MSQTDLVIHVPMMLQVRSVLVELLAIHAAHRIHNQVIVQVPCVDMCCYQNFKVGELFLGQLHPYGVCQLWG